MLMNIQLLKREIPIANEHIQGSLLSPAVTLPAIMFVHGWGGSQEQDLARARELSGLGCVCLTIDLRGHDLNSQRSETVTREENLQDLVVAYDWLACQPKVDPNAIAVIGISYGGYLAAILASLRPVRWLALRAPALYKDEGWHLPKRQLHADITLKDYRLSRISATENRALNACAAFRGDALIVESEHDALIPHAVIENYVAAFSNARSLTSRVIANADHALSEKQMRKAYTQLLTRWLTEMIFGERENAVKHELARNVLTDEPA
ncbi:MAG: alpha/beta fold hydrolase [Gammaproteobacteria bacterium]|nr:alpha/beta fold hydrolase [Gammaproteobacteria bacterium]